MINRILLAVFLLLNFQSVSATIATDIAAGSTAEQAAINAIYLSADEIAQQLADLNFTAGQIASALYSAGYTYRGTVESALMSVTPAFSTLVITTALNNTTGLSSGLAQGGAGSGGPRSLR